MELHLDIETLPTDRADVIDMLAASIKAPAQYKKPESIAQWLEENKASELDALHRKTALDGAFGHICCIGFAIDDEPATKARKHKFCAACPHTWMSWIVTATQHWL
jgi:hypothetical protein